MTTAARPEVNAAVRATPDGLGGASTLLTLFVGRVWAYPRGFQGVTGEEAYAMTVAQDLVDRGYFPRELPPPFTTHGFADLVRNQRTLLPAPNMWAACVAHNFARPGSLRRPLKIPNPQHHLQLAEVIDQDWATLVAAFRPALISVSAPMLRRTDRDRAVVPRFAPRVHARLRARRLAGGRYFLRADVSQFYPSLYTHVIPWALHSKAAAKAQMHNQALAGNRIDAALRRQQAG